MVNPWRAVSGATPQIGAKFRRSCAKRGKIRLSELPMLHHLQKGMAPSFGRLTLLSLPPTGSAPAMNAEPFASLSPDRILDAIDDILGQPEFALGWRASGQVLALNSYENRVFQIGLEACTQAPAALPGTSLNARTGAPAVIAKFYRPGRWTDAQILEEHAYLEALADAEVTAVAPLRLGGLTLHHVRDFRVALFPRRGGRTPELLDPRVREQLGRYLGRLHAVGARQAFSSRLRIDRFHYGDAPLRDLLQGGWLAPELAPVYEGLARQALNLVEAAFTSIDGLVWLRAHGDCHPGNLLWDEAGAEPGPVFLDFDDAAMAPAIQDVWMLLSGTPDEMRGQLDDLIRGYEWFRPFDRRELSLIEPLRCLRLIHYAAWIARRWSDPAFPAAFPWFGETRYWEARILELREQIAAMQEPVLEV